MKRRSFLARSVCGATGLSLGITALHASRISGAGERIGIALLGCGGRGRFVARGLVEEGADLVALCDLNAARLDQAEQFLSEVQIKKPTRYRDMRQLFDNKDVDAVVVATPDHWHAPASILACLADKDVYVEKPHAHNIVESQRMVQVARERDRIIQVGTQNRSAPYNHKAREYIQSGKLGRIGLVKVYNLKSGTEFRLGDTHRKPDDFDWDSWLGPAPVRAYHERIFNGGWHKFWDFSGGDLADDGIHQLDIAMMLMQDPGVPAGVACNGGRFVFDGDDAEVPDVQVASFDFPDFVLTFELTNYPRYMQKTTTTIRRNDEFPYWTQNATRIEIYGSETMMTIGRHGGGWQVMTSGGRVVEQMYGRPPDNLHYANFLDSIKSRTVPNADIRTAHPACVMVHMANIAHRIGNQKVRFDEQHGKFDSVAANKLLGREYRKNYELF